MRTIKFRAWDRYMKCMVDVKTLDFGPKGAECAVDDSDINGDIDGEWDLMQFTGIKDSNGTEIYEGDIVRVTSYNGSFIATIKWQGDDYPAFDLNNGSVPGWYVETNGLHTIKSVGINMIVIGNIYENPELVEERKNDDMDI